jgi:hypothetical protein
MLFPLSLFQLFGRVLSYAEKWGRVPYVASETEDVRDEKEG